MTDLSSAISVLFLVSGAFVMIVLVVMENIKRLRSHMDQTIESVRLEIRRESAEQEMHRARLERRVRDVEADLLELSRARANDSSRIDAAVKNFLAAVADLEKEKKVRQRVPNRRSAAESAATK